MFGAVTCIKNNLKGQPYLGFVLLEVERSLNLSEVVGVWEKGTESSDPAPHRRGAGPRLGGC